MNIAQALKVRKRLAARLAQVRKDVQEHNSYVAGNTPVVDVGDLLEEEERLVSKLVGLRSAIAQANHDLWPNLMEQAELKARIAYLGAIDTTQGRTAQSGLYGGPTESIEYAVQVPKSQADRLLSAAQRRLNMLVDDADTYNAITEVTFEVPEDLLYGPAE